MVFFDLRLTRTKVKTNANLFRIKAYLRSSSHSNKKAQQAPITMTSRMIGRFVACARIGRPATTSTQWHARVARYWIWLLYWFSMRHLNEYERNRYKCQVVVFTLITPPPPSPYHYVRYWIWTCHFNEFEREQKFSTNLTWTLRWAQLSGAQPWA